MIFVATKKGRKTNFPPFFCCRCLIPDREWIKIRMGWLSRILVPSLTCLALLTMLIVQQCFHYTVLLMISMFCHSESITCGSSWTVIESFKKSLCKTNVRWYLWNHKCKSQCFGYGLHPDSNGLANPDPGRPKLFPNNEKKKKLKKVLWWSGGFSWSVDVLFWRGFKKRPVWHFFYQNKFSSS